MEFYLIRVIKCLQSLLNKLIWVRMSKFLMGHLILREWFLISNGGGNWGQGLKVMFMKLRLKDFVGSMLIRLGKFIKIPSWLSKLFKKCLVNFAWRKTYNIRILCSINISWGSMTLFRKLMSSTFSWSFLVEGIWTST